MRRRSLIGSAAGLALAPRLLFAQTPTASPAAANTLPDFAGIPVALSPDGTKIAGIDGSGRVLLITDLTSGSEVRSDAVDIGITPLSLRWAPDSSAVAFSLETPKFLRDSDIYVMDARSGTLTDLTDDDPDKTGADEIGMSAEPGAGDVPIDLYPAWSPDGQHLLFARTMWSEDPAGTTLMTISRDGGEAESRFELQREFPMSVYSPMWWLDTDAILLAQWLITPDNPNNGIWRLEPDDTFTHLVPGHPQTGIPGAVIADVTRDGSRASVYSQIMLSQYGSSAPTKTWFDVDLTTGEFVPWETVLGLDTEPDHAMSSEGSNTPIAPPVFGPDDQSIAFMTRTHDGLIHVWIKEAGSPPDALTTLDPQRANAGGTPIGYRLDWADSGDLMILTPGGIADIMRP